MHSDDPLEITILAWLREELSLRKSREINLETEINHELGVAGDDGDRLMLAFARRFDVDVSRFPSGQYFGGEAAINPISLLWMLGRWAAGKRASPLEPLTIRDLVDLARSSRR